MDDPIKSVFSGITEGIISGVRGNARIEHSSNQDGFLEITGNYQSVTKNTGLHVGNGAQIKISGNAKIVQQD